MADQHPSKRRRLDAVAALSKPFKSPLRRPVPIDDASPSSMSGAGLVIASQDATEQASTTTPSKTVQGVRPFPLDTSPAVPRPKPVIRSSFSTPAKSPLSDPELLNLQKQQRLLQSKLTKLSDEIDIANQALRIESSTKDAELEALVIKWRLVSQEAADEVFVGAQDRILKMGGMAAWRERNKRDAMRWGFQEESQQVAGGDELERSNVEPVQDLMDSLKNENPLHAEDKEEEASSL